MLLVLTVALTLIACRRKNDETPDSSEQTGNAQQSQPATPLAGSMEENINTIMTQNPVEFMGGLMPVDLKDTSEDGKWALKNYTGFESPEKFTDIAVYEPMTGSQAFSLVLVRLAEGENTNAVARQMKEKIDPRKWICAGADQVMAAGYQDVVMFIMLDSNLGKNAQSYVDTFAALCGGKLDFTI